MLKIQRFEDPTTLGVVRYHMGASYAEDSEISRFRYIGDRGILYGS